MPDPIIEINNLSFSYQENKPVFSNINLSIFPGETIALIGPNGAGKSTFVSLLNGIRLGEGTVSINGTKMEKVTMPEIRKNIGVVFQNPDDQLFCPTVYDDIAFGPLNYGIENEEIRKRVSGALAMVGLEGFENRTINELSYGEKKLVSIATVLSMNPAIIVFDEPSSNLDPFHRRKIINWIANQKDQTIILTTHDLDMVLDIASRVILLNEGAIKADGTPETILSNKDLLELNKLELPLSRQ